jgi:hypothetical protein
MFDATTVARFWAKVDKQGPIPEGHPELGPCWLWTAAKNREGYGKFGINRTWISAHQIAYELLVGPIPEGLELDHLCQVPACVKVIADQFGPAHLEPVTHRENVLRGRSAAASHARKAHCPKGHPYDAVNTYRSPDGHRHCRTCGRNAVQRYKKRRRETDFIG